MQRAALGLFEIIGEFLVFVFWFRGVGDYAFGDNFEIVEHQSYIVVGCTYVLESYPVVGSFAQVYGCKDGAYGKFPIADSLSGGSHY